MGLGLGVALHHHRGGAGIFEATDAVDGLGDRRRGDDEGVGEGEAAVVDGEVAGHGFTGTEGAG
jgi:hypothetical protein